LKVSPPGFEPATYRSRSRHATTQPPHPTVLREPIGKPKVAYRCVLEEDYVQTDMNIYNANSYVKHTLTTELPCFNFHQGTTITMSLIVAAVAAAITFPASSIQARIGLSMAVASASTVASATAVLCFTTMRIDTEIMFAVVGAAAVSVAFAAAWAVGVMVSR